MGRILKVVGLVAGALVVLFVAVLLAVGFLVDPNDYKDQITTAVNDATGRTLTLEGDLELRVLPSIRIALGEAELSNAPGFGNEPFARIEGAELSVGLLPLLTRRIDVRRASLSGLRLNLARNAAGTTNWDDLARGGDAGAAAGDAGGDGEGAGGQLDLEVGAVQIVDAEVAWRDAMAGQDWVLGEFNLDASDFGTDRAFPLAMSFTLAGAEITAAVESEMRASISLAENRYRLDDLSVLIDGEGPGWPGGAGEAELAFTSFVADLDAQSLVLDGLELEMLGLSVSGDLAGENVMDSLSLVGGIEIDEFDPRELMAVFGVEIETADADVLGRASASAEFYYGAAAMGLREMALRLDDSSLTGAAGMRGERFEFDLDVDAINIDRYLPPPADDEEAQAPDEGSIDEVDLPLDPLRNFVASGNLSLAETQFLGMTLTDANFALAAGNGRMTLTPTGSLYGGAVAGEISIVVQGEAARLALEAALTDVDMAGIGRDFLKTEALVGTGNVALDVAATGSQIGAIKRDLDGTASVAITKGAWLGIDVWHSIQRARAVVTGPEVPDLDEEPRTRFDRIAIAGNVEDAVMTTTEFVAVLPFAALSGSGTIDLLTYELDIRAGAQLVDGEVLQQDPVIAGYAGATLPLTITGSLDSPSVRPDIRTLLSERAREELREEVDEAVDEVREGLRDRFRNLVN